MDRSQWIVRLRWFVPPAIVLSALMGRLAGVTVPLPSFLMVALFMLLYNLGFYLSGQRSRGLSVQRGHILKLNRFQVALDSVAIFVLMHFSGGIASPFVFFLTWPVVFAAILLSPGAGYGFASLSVAGMLAVYLAETSGWIGAHPLCWGAKILIAPPMAGQALVVLIFFAAAIYFTAFFTAAIVTTIRQKISRLADLTAAARQLNQRLNALYSMTEAVVSLKNLDTVLDRVTSALCQVMGVIGISVKLLSQDGRHLHYAAVSGPVAEIFRNRTIEVAKSPLNREIIDGKPFVTGRIKPGQMLFQFGEELAAANIQSVLFVPLAAGSKVIGIVGAYCKDEERFSPEEVEFFRRAAGLVAVAIENARSHEAGEALMTERNWFLMRVAHNLRSPLAAIISMLDVVRGGYQGALNAAQSEHLRRIDRRGRTMIRMISELLTLSQSREGSRIKALRPLDLRIIAGRIQRTFEDEARQKGLQFEMRVPTSLPTMQGDADMIEQALENLVSNAVKYTRRGGRVTVTFSEGPHRSVQIRISDTGIGISEADRKNIFTEFFRAENAREMDENGTGLGLAIVKQAIDQHDGRISVESAPVQGTVIEVSFPAAASGADP